MGMRTTARQDTELSSRPRDGRRYWTVVYGETVSHSSDSFPPVLAVDPGGGLSSDDQSTDNRTMRGVGCRPRGGGLPELTGSAETASDHGPYSGLGFICEERLSRQWQTLVQK
jgi:hypothetical protein